MSAKGMPVLVDPQGNSTPLTNRPLVAGRAAESDIVLVDAQASRRHFTVRPVAGGWELADLGSTNGTYVNGRRLRPDEVYLLALGDCITVGHVSFTAAVHAPASQYAASAAPVDRPEATPRGPVARAAANAGGVQAAAIPVWQWAVAALALVGMALSCIGAFRPWVRVDLNFTLSSLPLGETLSGWLSAAEKAASALFGAEPLVKSGSISLQGMDAYGGYVLVAAGFALLALLLDLGLRLARSALPGVLLLAAGLAPVLLILVEMRRFSGLAGREILFGVSLLNMIQGATRLLEPRLVLLGGLYTTGIGLGALVLAGVLRCLLPLLARGDSAPLAAPRRDR